MAKLAAEPICLGAAGLDTQFNSKWSSSIRYRSHSRCISSTIRASQPMDDQTNLYKELGMFSQKKKIEDSVVRAEMLAPKALEREEAQYCFRAETVRCYNLWDDEAKSNEVLGRLADSAKVVDSLRDLSYKAEEAKLITELAEMDAINYGLFKQAYTTSVHVDKLMYEYEMSKLLNLPYDYEGACIIVEARSECSHSEMWAEQLVEMYMRWGAKRGYDGRIVERCHSKKAGLKSITIEFECKFAYGYLSGEKGIHCMIKTSQTGRNIPKGCLAAVDVIPLFLEKSPDLIIDEKDVEISFISICEEKQARTKPAVQVKHNPTDLAVHSSGERSNFANKIKALNRLNAKLLVIFTEQQVSSVASLKKDAIVDMWDQETRKYVFGPQKLVEDFKTGVQVTDLNAVLDGNIEPFIGAYINIRQSFDDV